MPLFRAHLRALALLPVSPPSRPVSLFTFHFLFLTLTARLAHWPWWSAPLLLVVVSLPQLIRHRFFPEALAPLFALYALALVRLGLIYSLQQEVPSSLSYEWILLISAAWIGLIYLQTIRRARYAWGGVALAASALMAYLLWTNLPAGVTGSDPFAYVQMGLDLAHHGTPNHTFPLAPFVAQAGLPVLPVTHVGYVLPDATGLAPTVWPPGFSVLLALAYRVAGEAGMLSLNLWIGLINVALTGALTVALAPRSWRRLAGGAAFGAIALLATSPELLTRLSVPLADGAAMLFTTLTVLLALSFLSTDEADVSDYKKNFAFVVPSSRSLRLSLSLGAITGLALAIAYAIRYTQVLIGPGLALSILFRRRFTTNGGWFLIAFALAAFLGALPDIVYRTSLFGSPFKFGSGELALFGWRALPLALAQLRPALFSLREFGWLWPFMLVGLIYLWRRNRGVLLILAPTYLLLITFHLFYPFLKLRDLLSLYPPLMALTALGGLVAILGLWRRGVAARLLVIVSLFALAGARLAGLQPWWGDFSTFGYLRAEQRADLELINTLTEPDAVIACSLNSGAVELYGHRATVRAGNLLQPGLAWGPEYWLGFVAVVRAAQRPLYLLMDSPEMEAPLAAVREKYQVTRVADLRVPVFFVGGGSLNLTAPLYRVEP